MLGLLALLFSISCAYAQKAPHASTIGQRCEFSNGSFELIEGQLVRINPSGKVQWARQVGSGTSHIAATSTASVYGISGQKVYKLDGNGNLVWCLNFSAPPVPSNPEPTRLFGIAQVGSRLIIQVSQGLYFSMSFYTYDIGALIIDTAGVFVNIAVYHVVSSNFIHFLGCVTGFGDGAWLLYDNGEPIGSHCSIEFVDTNGHSIPSRMQGFWHSTYTTMHTMKPFRDSSFLVVTNTVNDMITMPIEMFNISKLDAQGNEIWSSSYYDAQATGASYGNLARSVTTDSLLNVYLLSDMYRDQDTGIVEGMLATKISPNGSVLSNRFWTSPPDSLWSRLRLDYSTGQVFGLGVDASGNGTSVQFDSQFDNTCMGPDTLYNLDRFSFNSISIPGNSFNSLVYSPVSDTINVQPINPTTFQDICFVLGTASIEKQRLLSYPNPVREELFLESDAPISPNSIKLFDTTGRKLEPTIQALEPGRMALDTKSLLPGYYIIQVNRPLGEQLITRFVKQ